MSGLFGGGSPAPTPAPPAPKPPAPMPDDQSPAVMEARRKAQMDILSRAGRSSTILTAPQQRGGAAPPDYSKSTLGGAT